MYASIWFVNQVKNSLNENPTLIWDISFLELMFRLKLNENSGFKIYIPQAIINLINKSITNNNYKDLENLVQFFFPFRIDKKNWDWELFTKNWEILKHKLKEDYIDQEKEIENLKIYKNIKENLLRIKLKYINNDIKFIISDSVTKVLLFSIFKKNPILMRTRKLASLLRENISHVLELMNPKSIFKELKKFLSSNINLNPNEMKDPFDLKKQLFEKIFKLKEKIDKIPKLIKFFIGMVSFFSGINPICLEQLPTVIQDILTNLNIDFRNGEEIFVEIIQSFGINIERDTLESFLSTFQKLKEISKLVLIFMDP